MKNNLIRTPLACANLSEPMHSIQLDAGVTINGNQVSDRLYGMGRNDSLFGMDGNDWLEGGTGNDGLCGDSGNDVLIVRADLLFGARRGLMALPRAAAIYGEWRTVA